MIHRIKYPSKVKEGSTHNLMMIQSIHNSINSKQKYVLGGPTTMISTLITTQKLIFLTITIQLRCKLFLL